MRQTTYSKQLENKLSHVNRKILQTIYYSCISKHMNIKPNMFDIVVQKQFATLIKANEEIETQLSYDGQMRIDDEVNWYWFWSEIDPNYYMRTYILAPSENVLVNMFSDKLLVMA